MAGVEGRVALITAGRDCAGGRGSDIREVALVEKDALQPGGVLAEHQHQAVGRRQSELDVVGETRRDFDDEMVVVLDIAVLDVNVAGGMLEDQLSDRCTTTLPSE